MTLLGLLLCLAAVTAGIVMPLLLVACKVAWDHPAAGALLAAPLLLSAYLIAPWRAFTHGGGIVDWLVFGFLGGSGVVIACVTAAGYYRLARARARRLRPELPRARVVPPR
jgi:hypothetical protein